MNVLHFDTSDDSQRALAGLRALAFTALMMGRPPLIERLELLQLVAAKGAAYPSTETLRWLHRYGTTIWKADDRPTSEDCARGITLALDMLETV